MVPDALFSSQTTKVLDLMLLICTTPYFCTLNFSFQNTNQFIQPISPLSNAGPLYMYTQNVVI